MARFQKLALGTVILLSVIFGVGFGVWRYNYPYGARPASLPLVLQALRAYSDDHGGEFPNTNTSPREALRLLHPRYLPDCEPIAGLSGDRDLMRKEIASGGPISEASSSWVYWGGLRSDDNPDIAIIWERQTGLRFNGSRAHGHEVGFVGGYMRQVQDVDWDAFMKDQERLRDQALRNRADKRKRDEVDASPK